MNGTAQKMLGPIKTYIFSLLNDEVYFATKL